MTVKQHPFLQQIDHVGIETDDPKRLFVFFTEVLGLPVAFPYIEYPFYTSGSVVLGNIFLEIMRFGTARASVKNPAARYYILGFSVRPGTLADSLAELGRRDVPHSGSVPFFAPEATDDNPEMIWENVYLGRLLDDNWWMRLFIAMTKRSKPRPSQARSVFLNRVVLGLMGRAFPHGLPVLTEYYRDNDEAKRAADREALVQCKGGGLGVERVQEIVMAVPTETGYQEVWERLLAPWEADSGHRYCLPSGPAIRLVHEEEPGVRTMVLQVTSLVEAEAFAAREGLSFVVEGDNGVLQVPQAGELTVELRERPR